MKTHAVLFRSAVLVALCAVLVGCGDENIGEPVGSATFFVENRTALAFQVTMSMPQGPEGTVEATVPPFTRARVYETSAFGVNPRPSHAFVKIEIRDYATGTLLYVQDPINNDVWIRVAPYEDYYEHYYASEYTLALSQGDILVR